MTKQSKMKNKNEGKRFEEDFQNSIPDNWFYYRLRDSSGSWSNTDTSRFTPTNMCDYFVFNRILYAFECKTTLGKSFAFTKLNDKKGKKLDAMCAMMKKKLKCGAYYVINFRELSETYAINANKMLDFKENSGRKSVSIEMARQYGRHIPQEKKRVRWKYDIGGTF